LEAQAANFVDNYTCDWSTCPKEVKDVSTAEAKMDKNIYCCENHKEHDAKNDWREVCQADGCDHELYINDIDFEQGPLRERRTSSHTRTPML
jgi:hypothetical protein